MSKAKYQNALTNIIMEFVKATGLKYEQVKLVTNVVLNNLWVAKKRTESEEEDEEP